MKAEALKILLKKKLFSVLFIASLIYTFPIYNKYWAPFDEGIIVVACQELLAGKIPYKDFFIAMYPPGQIYFLALLIKAFSSTIIVGRIYTVFISVGSAMLVFYITRFLTESFIIAFLAWLVIVVSLAPRLGAIPAPIWPGVFLSLCSIYAYLRYLKNQRLSWAIFTGLICGLSILFRHDMGIFAFFAILCSMLVKLLKDKDSIKAAIFFSGGVLLPIIMCASYFISKKAAKDMIDSLFLFPFIHRETAGLFFPKPCFNPLMIFHGSLYFIKVNQYYIPILAYVLTFFYLIYEFFKGRSRTVKNLLLLSILVFGILSFNQVLIRTDPAHLLTVIEPAVILSAFVIYKLLTSRFRFKAEALFRYMIIFILAGLLSLLAIKNIDKYIKNTFTKVYKGDTIATAFGHESVYVPRDEREEIVDTVNFIRKNTNLEEKIYVGNIVHWKDDFGGSLILYSLCDRLPATKYYEILPGLITQKKVQEEIVESLSKDDLKLIILQTIDVPRENDSDKITILDDYIRDNFRIVKQFGKYGIYEKR